MSPTHQSAHIRNASITANGILVKHSVANKSPAILGFPSPQLANDVKFQPYEAQHVATSEQLAQAALQVELLVRAVAEVPHSK